MIVTAEYWIDPREDQTVSPSSAVRSALLSASSCLFIFARAGHCQDTAAPVVVAPVIEREVHTARRIVGSVMPARTSIVGSAADGRVEEYLIDHGDAVRAGQPLARLRTDTLQIELMAAKAQLTLSEQELAELVNGALPEEVAESKAKLLAAEAVMNNTGTRLKRLESLRLSNAVSEDEFGDARERAEAARQLFLAAEALHKRIEDGPRVEQIAQAQARVELQRENVKLIEDRIEKHTIVAPFDGFIAAEYTEVGAWIRQGDPVADVIQLSEVEIHTPVPAEQAVQLEAEAPIRIEFPELPGKVFVGKVHRVVPMAAATTRTFPVYIRLQNEMANGVPRLMAGMLARVELPTGGRAQLPLVPKDAIVLDGRQQSVFVVSGARRGGEGTVRAVPIQLGVADNELIQVEGAIKAGDLVVVLGNERLNSGDPVTITRVTASSSAGETDNAGPRLDASAGP
jgi:RND family efflux transporter MFP subunit